MCVRLGCAETHCLRKIENSWFQRPDLKRKKINTLQCAVLRGKLISVDIYISKAHFWGIFQFLFVTQTKRACFCFCKQCFKVSESHCMFKQHIICIEQVVLGTSWEKWLVVEVTWRIMPYCLCSQKSSENTTLYTDLMRCWHVFILISNFRIIWCSNLGETISFCPRSK